MDGGSHEVAAKAALTLKTAIWHPLVPFHLQISHKEAKSMAKLSQLCGKLQLALCLSSGDGATDLKTA